MQTTINRIDKSTLRNMPFKTREILVDKDDIQRRLDDLNRAMLLGNLFKETVRLQFQNSRSEPMETEATVWSVTEKNVILKGGLTIPIHSISKVRL
ncbi:MAG: hypothetical protein AAGA66_15455 [Bacteroidota bacterium]